MRGDGMIVDVQVQSGLPPVCDSVMMTAPDRPVDRGEVSFQAVASYVFSDGARDYQYLTSGDSRSDECLTFSRAQL